MSTVRYGNSLSATVKHFYLFFVKTYRGSPIRTWDFHIIYIVCTLSLE